MNQQKNESFEDLLKRLEEIVDSLEDQTIGLEESIRLYEEGMSLTKQCRRILDEANGKIEIVMNGAAVVPFQEE
ncbi:MAG: exodeoxyribonuclease VII small subunit [Christensenellales bacterium]